MSRRLEGELLEDRRLLAAVPLITQAGFDAQAIVYDGIYLPSDPAAAISAIDRLESQADNTPVFIQEDTGPRLDGNDQRLSPIGTEFYASLTEFRADARFAGINGSGFATVVIDTGADLDHPHFGPDANADGIADRIVHQQSFTGTTSAEDDHGHGTHVLGIVGSGDANYLGVADEVSLVALKALAASGQGSFAWIEQALQWVVANATTLNIASVNMSLSDNGFYTQAVSRYGIGDELEALAALDVIVVSASGNGYAGSPGVSYPSSDPRSLSIGSERTSGGLSSFSQRDPELTTVFAPGQVITAAWPGGGVRGLQGTSMASPQVAGVAVLAQNLAVENLGRRLTVAEFEQLLRSTGPDAGVIPETGSFYPGVNLMKLAESIVAMDATETDLEVTQLSGTGGQFRGENITLDFTVTNNGTAHAPPSRLDFYLSRNGNITWTGDFLIGSFDVQGLAAGAPSSGTLEVTLPGANALAWDTDTNYTIGTIIDAGFEISESNEVNNFNSPGEGDKFDLVIENLPRNLIADNIVAANLTGLWGDTGEISFEVVNLGAGPSEPVEASVYLSKDANIDPDSDLLLGTRSVPRVDGGAAVPSDFTFQLPQPGDAFWDAVITDYYVGVQVDSSNQEAESDETDNFNRGVDEDIARLMLLPPPSKISGAAYVDLDSDGRFIDRFDDEFRITHSFPGSINPFQAKTFTWTNLPEFRDNATLSIRMRSDIGAASRYLSVRLDNNLQLAYFTGDLPEGSGVVLAERTMQLSGEPWLSAIADGEMQISVDVSFNGSFTTSSQDFIEATLTYNAESQTLASFSQRARDSVIRGTQDVMIAATHEAAGDATIEFMAVGLLGGSSRTATLDLEGGNLFHFFSDTPASNAPLVYEKESVTIPVDTFNEWLADGRISGALTFSDAVSAQFPGSIYEIQVRYPIAAADGVSQRLVTLDLNNNGTIDRTTLTAIDDPATSVDESGYYEFQDVPVGSHRVGFPSTDGWSITSANSIIVDVIAGLSNPDQDFGVVTTSLVSGPITADTRWENTSQPYYLTQDLMVENGATLTIASGVRVERLNLTYQLHVGNGEQNGSLDVDGAQLATGIFIHPNSNALLNQSDVIGGNVDVFGTLRASEILLDSNLSTFEGSDLAIRFSQFAEAKTFDLHSGGNHALFFNDFGRVSDNGFRTSGDAGTLVSLRKNWWATSDEEVIAMKVVDQRDDDTLPLADTTGYLDVYPLLGDANHDGRVSNADIAPFVLALTDREQYAIDFPEAEPDISLDFNWSGSFTNADIPGFITRLTEGGENRNEPGEYDPGTYDPGYGRSTIPGGAPSGAGSPHRLSLPDKSSIFMPSRKAARSTQGNLISLKHPPLTDLTRPSTKAVDSALAGWNTDWY